ncbi:hypothetical protein SAMN05892883_3727 [Jatrophihabitans sp. GAS493]|uniref:hypothetical protein n=1 Tax=Jatrophihabitans sp. GAS493 TaxID=1907575 RepID=UPI000BB956D1|nr:hypothetical protein [Jatrophihabitans sp. GAS493]SOD74541.1 hypothetical protein SAMN05892883_3727 [Jatrophihabitans sp. GAS493]
MLRSYDERRRNQSQVGGLLAGEGAEMLRATVYTRAIPVRPPSDLDELVRPVYDIDGELHDWRLEPTNTQRGIDPEEFHRYRSWRHGFAEERFLGERGLVYAFLDWIAGRTDTSLLNALRLPRAHVGFHKALRMHMQVENAQHLITHDDMGIGLYSGSSHRGAFRAVIPSDPPTTLLAWDQSVLTVGPHGLCMRRMAYDEILDIRGWRIVDQQVTVRVGETTVDLGSSSGGARLLRMAGREALEVEVESSPLATLLAPLLISLSDATRLAGGIGADLFIRSNWS